MSWWRKFASGLVVSGAVCFGLLILGFMSFGIIFLPLIVVMPVACYLVSVRLFRSHAQHNHEHGALLLGTLLPMLVFTLEIFYFSRDFLFPS